jgi:glycosyltransferase involved in cell wall biosynthesis
MNAALTLARGDWIAPLDDDDEFLPTHVEELLNAARSARAELVFSKALMAGADDWQVVGDLPLREGHISHGSVLYSAGLRFFRYSDTCWRLAEPADWNLWKRMHRAGVRVAFHPFVTYRHF